MGVAESDTASIWFAPVTTLSWFANKAALTCTARDSTSTSETFAAFMPGPENDTVPPVTR
ncbi:hypothetical protein WJ39_08295 [Burkholderia diffusa]|nr:hypothetical protein WJ39_08295 [Burkholderia diffusa]